MGFASLDDPESWNHPAWPRYVVPLCASAGAVAGNVLAGHAGIDPSVGAGIGAGLSVFVAAPALALAD